MTDGETPPQVVQKPAKSSKKWLLLLSTVVVIISVGWWQLGVHHTVGEINPDIIKKQMFPMEKSINPQYDTNAYMEEYREAMKNSWTVWSKQALFKASDYAIEHLPPVEPTESNRWFFQYGKVRLTFLTSRLVRIEWAHEDQFQNNPTIVFSEREEYLKSKENKMPLVKVYEEIENRVVVIETEDLKITYGNPEVKFPSRNNYLFINSNN